MDQLKLNVQEAEKNLKVARELFNSALVDAYSFKVGDIIVNKNNDERRVSSVSAQFGYINMKGQAKLKNGEWGNREVHICTYVDNWKKLENN